MSHHPDLGHDHVRVTGPAGHTDLGHQRGLDLDAEVFGDQLTQAMDSVDVESVSSIVDLGAGTGVGSRMLRHRYPEAAITCVDNDEQMLARLVDQGFTTIRADLDAGFPALNTGAGSVDRLRDDEPAVDLVWVSSSLHHVQNPARLLSGIRQALAPRGALLVVELAALPSFLQAAEEAALEERCQVAAAAEGWNHYTDWQPVIADAGFDVTKTEITTTAPVTAHAREYAQQWLSRYLLLSTLAPDDRADLRALLQRPAGDLALNPYAARTVWAATPLQQQREAQR